MTETWALTKGQQRVVLALAQQRQEVVAGANKALGEIEAATREMVMRVVNYG